MELSALGLGQGENIVKTMAIEAMIHTPNGFSPDHWKCILKLHISFQFVCTKCPDRSEIHYI